MREVGRGDHVILFRRRAPASEIHVAMLYYCSIYYIILYAYTYHIVVIVNTCICTWKQVQQHAAALIDQTQHPSLDIVPELPSPRPQTVGMLKACMPRPSGMPQPPRRSKALANMRLVLTSKSFSSLPVFVMLRCLHTYLKPSSPPPGKGLFLL